MGDSSGARVIDPTRQGVTTHGPEAGGYTNAPPVTLDEAMATVAGWEHNGMPLFGLHRIAQALRGEVVRLRGETK